MVKNIIREIIIVLLLILAIILILGVLLYEYVPSNKVIPKTEAYATPQSVQEELINNSAEAEQLDITYEITASDLNNYQKVNDYKPGKKNPFGNVGTTQGNESNASGGQVTGGGNTSGASTGTNSSGTSAQTNNEPYYPDKGVK